jgi:uncharacterized membrane protein YeaQ/YmgE (transglycosylase-associated protein family)
LGASVIILLWVVIGLGAGWAIGALMLGRDSRRGRELSAGLIGAFLGPLVLQLLGSAASADALTASMAALAGALWVVCVVCVVTSGDVAVNSLEEGTDMVSYGTARNSLVAELLKDAAAHEAGRFDEVGRRFEGVERDLPRGTAPALTKLRVALAFWDGWIDARDHGWQAGGDIPKGEWPMLARRIASDLSADSDISDARVGARFDASVGGSLAGRMQPLEAPLRTV